MLGKDYERQDCSIARALEVVGERWTLLIVRDALYGVRRFNDFHAHLDVPKAVLSDRLSSLVEHGILERGPIRITPGATCTSSPPRDATSGPCCTRCSSGASNHDFPNSRRFVHHRAAPSSMARAPARPAGSPRRSTRS